MKVTKAGRMGGVEIERMKAAELMTSSRKMGHKKRNPITASAPGWKAPKMTPAKRKFS